ncbi:Nacht domain protein [Rutstroemia sp. NJR-2017a BVV2]|nr:Nacht domain protein [Rutstroemia sp. NJR-2017a BVV2]
MVIDLLLNANAENVDGIKSAVQVANLLDSEKEAIFAEIAARGSIYQLRLAKDLFDVSHDAVWNAMILAIEAKNEECFEFLIKTWVQRDKPMWTQKPITKIFAKILHSNSIDMYKVFEKYATEDIDICIAEGNAKANIAFGYMHRGVLSATTGNFQKEQLLLNFINENDIIKAMSKQNLGRSLADVAQSSCSVRLATLLIEAGANVDYRRSGRYMTPLHYAARKTSVEAAELMKFLLQRGADPEVTAGEEERRLQEEEGPKGISKWLGISWNELVEQTKKERDDMQAKQISSPL